MEKEYKIHYNISDDMHSKFNIECSNVNIENFRNNHFMRGIVQNCSYESGYEQLQFICNNYKEVFDKIDFNLIKKYDSVGGYDNNLINGLTPKVFSYIRESIIFCKFYLEPNKIKNINNLLIIGGGYGMESCIIHYISCIMGVKINKINCIDMPNVAKLQNLYFDSIEMNEVCKSYGPHEYNDIPDIVYSNCCLAELTCDINYDYYSRFCSKSRGFYIVWGLWASNLPKYYIPYIVNGEHHKLLNDGLINKNTNAILVKYELIERKISLAIPHYNNSSYIRDAIDPLINDSRINEIIICDDKSNDIDELEKIILNYNNPKIKLFKNETNLGCYHNKINTVSKCSNDWAILLDSDNVYDKKCIDTLYNIPNWNENTIYHPCWAKTFPSEPSIFLDFRCFSNTTITKRFYLDNFNNNNFQCLINNCNYFLPTKSFINCVNDPKSIFEREKMDVLDSAVLFTNWLCNNKYFVIISDLIYNHRLHQKSNYMLSPSHEYRDNVLQYLYDKVKLSNI